MRACLLNGSEASHLECEGVLPNCQNHVHVSYSEAALNVEMETWRWVTGGWDQQSRRRVTPTPEYKGYANRPSVIRGAKGEAIGVVTVKQALIARRF